MLWTANTALVTVMSWSSSYNEALCSLFLLSALALFIRYVETGRAWFWWWQLVVFTLGFGALEINVVYPALAAAYVLFVVPVEKRRRFLMGLIPLFCISVAYFLVHRAAVSLPADGPYALHLDRRIFRTLGAYWKWSLVPQTWKDVGHSRQSERAIVWILTLALLAFSVKKLANRHYQVLFFAFWYLITLAPMLPLPDHRTDYYLTIPLIGLAMLGGWGVSQALRSRWTWQVATLIPLAVYLGCMIPVTRTASRWWLDRSQGVRGLVLGVQAAEATHPGKTIVLDGITSDLYNASLADSAITSIGLKEAYLTPASRDTIHPVNDLGRFPHLVMEPGPMRNAITHDEVVVYSDVGDHLRNITGVWERSINLVHSPTRNPVGLKSGIPCWRICWVPNGFRWRTAFAGCPRGQLCAWVGQGPRKTSCFSKAIARRQLKAGDVHLSVSVDGIPLGNAQIINPESNFRRLLDLPPSLTGRSTVTVAICGRPGDPRAWRARAGVDFRNDRDSSSTFWY